MHKRVIVPSESNSNLLYASKTKIEGDFAPASHKHPNLELLYVDKGRGYLQSTNRKIEMKEGDVFLINKDVRHYEASPKMNLEFYAIGAKNLQAYLQDNLEKKILYFSTEKKDDIYFLFQKIYREIDEKKENYLPLVSSLFSSLELEIGRYLKVKFETIDSSSYSSLIASCLSILDNHFFENLEISTLAKRLGVSKSYLSHLFKEEVGCSIVQYKIKKQLEEANNLLKISDLPIGDIAFQVGINDLSYFCKQYKFHYSKSPLSERVKTTKKAPR